MFVYRWFRSIYKYFLHLMSGKSEIERICEKKFSPSTTIWEVSISLRKSKVLNNLSNVIFAPTVFTPNDYLGYILDKKGIKKENISVVSNLHRSLDGLNLINVVITHIDTLKNEEFSYDNKHHIDLLLKYWDVMKPNTRRIPYVLKNNDSCNVGNLNGIEYWSPDWGDLGFQGVDPSTDFRAMGMFGLLQLLYMSEHETVLSQEILLESHHPRRFFPYSATGINITYYIYTLLQQRRLDNYIYNKLEQNNEYMTHIEQLHVHDSIPTYTDSSSSIHSTKSSNSESSSKKRISGKLLSLTSPSLPIQSSTNLSTDITTYYSMSLIQSILNELHILYIDIYRQFIHLWCERDPPNIMAFKDIFQEIKDQIEIKFPRLDDC